MAALYVGDLHAAVTEEDLVHIFGYYGTVLSVRVCRDRISGNSLRYGYVTVDSNQNAENALRGLNHTILKGKSIRVMWSNRNPTQRKNGIGNLFVKNLDDSIGGAELEDLFKPYGRVDSCKVEVDEKGRNRGFGFVQMTTEEAAQSAIAALNGTVLHGSIKKLYVAKFVPKNQRKTTPEQPQGSSNLYIKNLEKDITDDFLREKFSEFGKVIRAVVMKDDNGKSKGFGFVCFESTEEAKMAMEAMNAAKLGSKTLYVGLAQKKADREYTIMKHFGESHGQHLVRKTQGSAVYVKHFNGCVTDKSLREHFASCGKILWTKVHRDNSGQSKGFGFVCFSSLEEAKKAVATLNGSELNGRYLYVAMAQHKEDRLYASQNWHPTEKNYPLLYHHPVYYTDQQAENLLSSAPYQPCRLGFSIWNHGFQSLPTSPAYYLDEQVSHANGWFNNMLPLQSYPPTVYPPRETYHMQIQKPGGSGPKKGGSKVVSHDQQTWFNKSNMIETLCFLVPDLEPEHASKIAEMMLQMRRTKLCELLVRPWMLVDRVKEASKLLRSEDKLVTSPAIP
ncbi:hypothetical protein HPP92_022915 [Vanilla planifolia]|uniref:Polyadenylate-binding protein n=1 Tax=Vanilla planifolia TaxID=51239 RepID=A0A835PV13_VANPL|nr:hypothetical protein HPP92_022915 [Vanilla planifolia]